MTALFGYTFGNNFDFNLTSDMTAVQTTLPISGADETTLLAVMTPNDVMVATLTDGVTNEIIFMRNFGGVVDIIFRGFEGTTAAAWTSASGRITGRVTAGILADIVTVVEALEDTDDTQDTSIAGKAEQSAVDALIPSILTASGAVLVNQDGDVVTSV